jgi:hypothetical protein
VINVFFSLVLLLSVGIVLRCFMFLLCLKKGFLVMGLCCFFP